MHARHVLALVALTLSAAAARADDALVAVRLDDRVVADALPALVDGERVYLPLAQLAAVLALGGAVDAEAGREPGRAHG